MKRVVTSEPTKPVENVNDAPTNKPNISGEAKEKNELTASYQPTDPDGVPSDVQITYTWSNSKTGSRITLTQEDVGKQISVTAKYTDSQGNEESVTSEPTKPVENVNDTPTNKTKHLG